MTILTEPTPVVLIHGFIGSLDEPAIASALRPHPILAPPLLGYGSNAQVDSSSITLAAQAEYVATVALERFGNSVVHLIGHSVGGAIAALVASRYPERTASLVSVEGNFSLKDAFWSAKVGRMSEAEATHMLAGFRADPAAWLIRAGVEPTPAHVAIAARWLHQQPSETLQAVGRSVVETTGAPEYQEMLQAVFARTPVHLVAGERSRAGWDVPAWAERQAASFAIVPSSGHMVMLDNPDGFGDLVTRALAGSTGRPLRGH